MIDILALLVAVALSLPLIYLGIELIAGLRSMAVPHEDRIDGLRIAILIPAHDEDPGIADTVRALARSAPQAEILVVADNCRDATAALAREAGAAVVERHDPERRGKGYALAFGREQLALDPPDAVIILDADCRLEPGSAERLAGRALAATRPAQAANLLTANANDTPLVAVSNFAMLVKNLVRARGLMRLGGGAMLFGTGMAFAWPLFTTLPLATGDAVEDLGLGLHLAKQGVRVELVDSALVTSRAAGVESSRAQRSRWEHGFLRTAAAQGLPFLLRGIARRSAHLTTLGAHLLVPPLALLMLCAAFTLSALAVVALYDGYWMPLLILAASLGFSCGMLLIVWWRDGRETLPFMALLRIPLYILWKIPIYVGFFTRRQTDWNRTARDAGD